MNDATSDEKSELQPLRRGTALRLLLGLRRHREPILARPLADLLRMLLPNVLLGVRHELVVGLAADDLTAFALDLLRH